MDTNFKALVIEEQEEKKYSRVIKTKSVNELPEGDVLIRVKYSSLNYKDALSAIGNKGVTKNYPHTPGIDAAGVVEESNSADFKVGDSVIVTSYDLGMNTPGGYGQYIRVPKEWVVKLPEGLSLKEAMIIGTAGFTAGQSVMNIVKNVKTDAGEVLVTGATGGVGSVAVALLSKLGYKVVGITGKNDQIEYLKNLGASRVILRDEYKIDPRPLLRGEWAGVVDTVGGEYLTNAIKSTNLYGTITTCGSVNATDLPLSVFPFILRGVSLVGISSQNCPMQPRVEIWNKLATEWKPEQLMDIYKEVSLEDLSEQIDLILKGKIKGRVIVNLD